MVCMTVPLASNLALAGFFFIPKRKRFSAGSFFPQVQESYYVHGLFVQKILRRSTTKKDAEVCVQ